MNPNETSLINGLRSNWFIILFIGSLIITWTTFGNRLSQAEAQILENKSTLQTVQDIKIDIAKIQKDIEFIKNTL